MPGRTSSPPAENNSALIDKLTEELLRASERATARQREGMEALIRWMQQHATIRIEHRVGWVSILLAILLGLALFPLAAHVALPAWQEHREHSEREFIIAELKKIPSAASESHR